MTAACHCRGCQKMASSAFSLTVMVPAASFRVVSGEPVKGGAKGPELDHMCCPECHSWMFTHIIGMDDFINVRPTMFGDASWAKPFIETVTRDKLPWACTGATHSFEVFPEMAELPGLLQAFASRERDG